MGVVISNTYTLYARQLKAVISWHSFLYLTIAYAGLAIIWDLAKIAEIPSSPVLSFLVPRGTVVPN